MRISDLIKWLEAKQKEIGDVEIFWQNGDGRSSWASKFNPNIVLKSEWFKKEAVYYFEHEGY